MVKEYLGDGLYVDFDGYQIRLSASNGIIDTNVVYLDSGVLTAFLNYVERLKQEYKKKMEENEFEVAITDDYALEREKLTFKMDKYELIAVGQYYSEWPENMTFSDLMNALSSGEDIKDIWPAVEYEHIPNEDMATLIKDMVATLRGVF